jgi:G:T-mismatch repair DNA endonuclease (very short patch repair protein)
MGSKAGWHHSPESREKIRKANTGKDNSYRGKNISEALKQRPFYEDEWTKMASIHSMYPWVTNLHSFIKLTGIEETFGKVKKMRRAEIYDKILRRDYTGKYFPMHIQEWSIETIEQFKKEVNSIGYTKYDASDFFKSKYGLTIKEYCHVVKVMMGISTTVFPRTSKPCKKQTSIESFIQKVLDQYGIMYQAEKYICDNHWRVDFLLDGHKVIESYGTYHHADPRVFREIDLDRIQKFNIQRDRDRNDWLARNNYELLIIWQKDIQERPEWVVAELLKYAGLQGVRYERNTEKFYGELFQTSLWD